MKAQYTLRDIFWLAAVVGLAIAWWGDHRLAWTLAANHERQAFILKRMVESMSGNKVTLDEAGGVSFAVPFRVE